MQSTSGLWVSRRWQRCCRCRRMQRCRVGHHGHAAAGSEQLRLLFAEDNEFAKECCEAIAVRVWRGSKTMACRLRRFVKRHQSRRHVDGSWAAFPGQMHRVSLSDPRPAVLLSCSERAHFLALFPALRLGSPPGISTTA